MNREPIEFARDQLRRIGNDQTMAWRFDLEMWGSSESSHPIGEEPVGCGFAGCLVGWAAHEQWFDRFGLEIRLVESNPVTGLRRLVPVIDGDKAMSAEVHLARFLELGVGTVRALIYDENYVSSPTALEVAGRLQRLLDEGEEAVLDDAQQAGRERDETEGERYSGDPDDA